jgi:tetratricopeptide (TPR) repeat protein
VSKTAASRCGSIDQLPEGGRLRRFAIPCALLIAVGAAVSASARTVDDAMSLYLQGLQHATDGELDSAIEDLAAAAQIDTTAAEIPRELARVLIEARRIDEALPIAQRAQRMAPDDPDANGLLGQVRMLRGEPVEAIASLERAHSLDPSSRTHFISLILAYETVGRTDEALQMLSPEQGGRDPDSPMLYFHRGILRTRRNQPREAIGDFLAVMRLAPDFPGVVDQLIATCWRLGPSDSTAAACLQALELAPDRNDLRRECARNLITLGRQHEAIPLLERLHQDEPGDASVAMQLGVIRFGQDRLPEAISLLKRARELDPTLQDSEDWLWRAYNRADSLGAALRAADEMVRSAPRDRKGHWYRALSLARLDRPDSALVELDQVLTLAPGDRDAGLLAALIQMDQGKVELARDGLVRIAERHPDDREVLFRLGGLEQRAGRFREAVGWYRRLLEKHPDDAAALNEAGYLCADEGIELPQALAWTSRAVELDPDNAAYQDSYGWTLYRLGRFQEAVEPLRKAAGLDPREPLLRIHLAKALHSAGRREEGRQLLRELLVDQPNERQARELLQLWETESRPRNGNSR